MKVLTLALEDVRRNCGISSIIDSDEVRRAKEMLREALQLNKIILNTSNFIDCIYTSSLNTSTSESLALFITSVGQVL